MDGEGAGSGSGVNGAAVMLALGARLLWGRSPVSDEALAVTDDG